MKMIDFTSRVGYAVACIKSGDTNHRKFDSCFEMYDGKYVVTAIVRKARADKNLESKLQVLVGQYLTDWQDVARLFDHLTNVELKEAKKHQLQSMNVY
jgi:hypothetical protein